MHSWESWHRHTFSTEIWLFKMFVSDPDVLDTWFSSGLFPFAMLGWPQQVLHFKVHFSFNIMSSWKKLDQKKRTNNKESLCTDILEMNVLWSPSLSSDRRLETVLPQFHSGNRKWSHLLLGSQDGDAGQRVDRPAAL